MTTTHIPGAVVAERLEAVLPGIVLEADDGSVTIKAERVVEVSLFLRDDEELDCKYLNSLTAVDWLDHFDIVYHLSSLAKNHALVLKARAGHESPIVPSVTSVWLAANLQEREVFDLMGIAFSDHPALKRIFLWEGFPGHPLRKDFLALPGGYKPGLQRFPFEFPQGQRTYEALEGTTSPSAPPVPRLDQPPPQPFPIAQRETGERERLAEHVRAEPEARLPPEQPQGAGADPTQAGGAAEEPEDTADRGHAGPGAGAGEGPDRSGREAPP